MSAQNEQEEFEFRHRLEQEAAAPAAPEEGVLDKVGNFFSGKYAAKPEPVGFDGRMVPPEERTPIEPSVAQNWAYPGGVVSTAAIQGTKALAGKGSMDDMKAAIAGHAKGAPQQLQESGMSPVASYIAGIPLQVATDPIADFTSAPFEAALSPVAKYIGGGLRNGAEAFATSPMFDKIANATNVVGKGKSLIDKIAGSGAIPESLQPAADAASGIAGRAAVYKSPLAPVQAVSDAAMGMTYAQQGVGKLLDKADPIIQSLSSTKIFTEPQLGRIASSPFFQVLKNAGEKGGPSGIATTHYVLQQTDPKYQQILKDEQE